MGRSTQGVILMRFTDKTDGVAAMATLEKEIDDEDSKANSQTPKNSAKSS